MLKKYLMHFKFKLLLQWTINFKACTVAAASVTLLFRVKHSLPDAGTVCVTESHQVLAQLLDTLLVIGTQLPENPTVRHRLIEVACKVTDP